MTENQVLAGAKWLCQDTNKEAWDEVSAERKRSLLRWTRGIIAAAEAAAPAAPAPPPVADIDRYWAHLVAVSSS